jgi:Spy/CpxP family protein refolding chaperone
MRKMTLAFAAASFAIPHVTAAQHLDLEAQLRPYLAPPELVMRHQGQINITDEQREIISQKVSELQSGVIDLQWQLEALSQTLIDEVRRDTVDLDAAIEQFDRVLEIEASIKRNHIRLLLEIRNTLNAEQWRQLQEIVEEMSHREGREELVRHREMELHEHNPAQERPERIPG